MAVVILPDNLDEMIDEAGKPALPEGKYLAIIVGGEPKLSENGKNSYGVNWKLLVNTNPNSLTDGWDTEASTLEVNFYSYIGKYAGGRLTDTDKGWLFTKMMKFLGVQGLKSLDTDAHKFRQIGVIVEHVAGKDDREAMKADPTHVPDQLYVGIKTVFNYIVGEESCPVLAYLADAYEAPPTPEDEPEDEPEDAPETEVVTEEKPKRGKKKAEVDAASAEDGSW